MLSIRFTFLTMTAFLIVSWLGTCICNAQPEAYGLSANMRDLTDLGIIHERKDLGAIEKADVLITWFIQERQNPSPATKGLGGGDINSGYIQAQILMGVSVYGDSLLIGEIASDPDANPRVRDAMRIALSGKGDASQVPVLIEVLEKHPEPFFRYLAAVNLAQLGAAEAIPVLEQALKDEYSDAGRRLFQRTLYGLPCPACCG